MGDCYALPTKHTPWKRMTLDEVSIHVQRFISYAWLHQEDQFHLTPVGCGLAGFTPAQIAPLFCRAPSNVDLPEEFVRVLGDNLKSISDGREGSGELEIRQSGGTTTR